MIYGTGSRTVGSTGDWTQTITFTDITGSTVATEKRDFSTASGVENGSLTAPSGEVLYTEVVTKDATTGVTRTEATIGADGVKSVMEEDASGNKKATITNADGTTTVHEEKSDGTKSETSYNQDGSVKAETTNDASGNQSSTQTGTDGSTTTDSTSADGTTSHTACTATNTCTTDVTQPDGTT
jgi:hypothetical protein